MPETYKPSGYLVLEPVRARHGSRPIIGARMSRITQNKPTNLANGAVAVAITVQIPAAAFEPLKPAALIVVPEELVQHEVTAVASDPDERIAP